MENASGHSADKISSLATHVALGVTGVAGMCHAV